MHSFTYIQRLPFLPTFHLPELVVNLEGQGGQLPLPTRTPQSFELLFFPVAAGLKVKSLLCTVGLEHLSLSQHNIIGIVYAGFSSHEKGIEFENQLMSEEVISHWCWWMQKANRIRSSSTWNTHQFPRSLVANRKWLKYIAFRHQFSELSSTWTRSMRKQKRGNFFRYYEILKKYWRYTPSERASNMFEHWTLLSINSSAAVSLEGSSPYTGRSDKRRVPTLRFGNASPSGRTRQLLNGE